MLEDRLLVWRFNRGSEPALARIYEKYRDDLLRLATALLNDTSNAEDIVQDVFVGFARSAGQFQLTGTLRGFLATCVANRARNRNLSRKRRKTVELDNGNPVGSDAKPPDRWLIENEQLRQLTDAMARLPYEQREAITLRLHGEMKFREIASLQQVPIKTTQSRYRCGLEKLRSILNSEVIE
ncbi:MAG: RNA polymerase sigma factor [Planctomycetota bacterium]|jgi:RNA polymerase sigma-70 factor (ECF subfamily)